MSTDITSFKKKQLVNEVPFWWHSIDVGDGVVTPGRRDLKGMHSKWDSCKIPDLKGKSVLDIGAWDGFFCFESERRGARRVVALDKYVWSLDLANARELAKTMQDAGIQQQRWIPRYYQPAKLPTKLGFDTAHRLLNSRVEQVIDDLITVDLETLGSFDIVFYLGGLYHMENPMQICRRLALLTREKVIIETAGIRVPDIDTPMFEYYGDRELNNDSSNWWAPNPAGLVSMLKAAGFKDAEIVAETGISQCENSSLQRNRLFAHAWH